MFDFVSNVNMCTLNGRGRSWIGENIQNEKICTFDVFTLIFKKGKWWRLVFFFSCLLAWHKTQVIMSCWSSSNQRKTKYGHPQPGLADRAFSSYFCLYLGLYLLFTGPQLSRSKTMRISRKEAGAEEEAGWGAALHWPGLPPAVAWLAGPPKNSPTADSPQDFCWSHLSHIHNLAESSSSH